ncbi:MAG: hypothetical protein ACOVQR_04425 [Flavobacterium sp.]|jgi:hypothetical protein|uniref:hypothetical protein n=1 Tax=Flavobacterium sp. TaxID=239 RepID=UPI003BA529FB
MTEIELSELLARLTILKQKAFEDSPPNAPALSQLVSQLNSVPNPRKNYFSDFAKSLKQELFINSIIIKSFNPDDFISKEPDDKLSQNDEISVERIEKNVHIEFIELFKDLVANITEHFDVYKGYFILKLENNPQKSYKLLILYDNSFIVEPVKKKIATFNKNSTSKTITEFIGEIDEIDNSDNNYLCLLLLMPRINNKIEENELILNINTLISNFSYFENISLKINNGKIQNDYHRSIDREEFIEELRYVNCTLLSNGSFKHEEEKIVKKLATNFRTPLVLYKVLKGGNSGSNVIEIRPKKELGEQYEKRYIIKYSEINVERKLKKEKENFDEWIRGYKGFNEYECHYNKTLTHEGILYSYAVADTEKESYSFSDIIIDIYNPFFYQKNDLISNLFDDLGIYQTWSNIVEIKKMKVSDLYSEYLNQEKIIEQISLIQNKNSTEVLNDELVVNFKKIWDYESEFNIKICHGDLHTDNLFKDNKNIYLIDFGYTGKKHSVIDHASLECSIKFKHFPFYIGINELIEIENELILESSFSLSARFNNTSRQRLIELIDLIKQIRFNVIKQTYTKTKEEYYLSVFIMTFRQIRYKDMNQLYAYNSALILSRYLITKLGIT